MKKGMESNKYNWIPKKIDDYNTNQIRFFLHAFRFNPPQSWYVYDVLREQ